LSENATTNVQSSPITSRIRGAGKPIRRSVPDNVRYGNIGGLRIRDSITKMRGALTKLPIRRSKKARQRKGIPAMNSCKECRSVYARSQRKAEVWCYARKRWCHINLILSIIEVLQRLDFSNSISGTRI
jgi:hypothetical protein